MHCQVVSAAGAVDHDEVVQLAEKAFSGLSSDPTTATELIDAVRPHHLPVLMLRKPNTMQNVVLERWTQTAGSNHASIRLLRSQIRTLPSSILFGTGKFVDRTATAVCHRFCGCRRSRRISRGPT